MNEKLLQYIWQFQLFNKSELETNENKPLQIIKQGSSNDNQGPDFLNASIIIDHIKWSGNIELHIHTSDWIKHKHDTDKNYQNVILHVVWENDKPIDRNIPVLELKERVSKHLIAKYETLIKNPYYQSCHSFLPALSSLGWLAWKERLVAERLERKALLCLELLQKNNNNWEEMFWQKLSANFGIKVNADFFESVAKSVSVNVLAKHKNQIHQIEAMLLGQANLLNKKFDDKYAVLLQKEYLFLKQKHNLQTIFLEPNFLRMRPANFPTIRLAQLAMLIHNSSHLFSKIKETENINEMKQLFEVTANDYWNTHYIFDEETPRKPKHLGKQTINNICINTISPVLFAYGIYTKNEMYKQRAVQLLQSIEKETNAITKLWSSVEHTSAFDSQAFIELTNNYCKMQKCLHCSVGNKILRS